MILGWQNICSTWLLWGFAQAALAQNALPTDVFDLARHGDSLAVAHWLAAQPTSLDSTNAAGYTPLMLAAYHGNRAFVAQAAPRVKDIDAGSAYGTALMAAAVKGEADIVGLLLAAGANPDLTDAQGATALIYAANFRHPDVVRVLLAAGANPDLADQRDYRALDYAQLHQHTELIILLSP